MTMVSIGGTDEAAADTIVLANYDYGEQNGHLNSMTYGNGDSITYHYDELDRMTKEVWNEDSVDEHSYEYFYNSEGVLTKKVDTDTGIAVNYEYDSIARLSTRTNSFFEQTYAYKTTGDTTTTQVESIDYDASGLPYSCVYDGSRYYYVLNQQGDVIRIVGYLGATLCEYQYDAWGNVIDITGTYKNTIGKINPIRYRGYYYDTETGFYYLQSRYYDPSIGRFINADSFASTGQGFLGYNMFAYCNNNPVFRFDESGAFSILGAVVGGVTGFVTSFATGNGLGKSLFSGMINAFVGGLEAYAVAANAFLALFEFNEYMMNGMDIGTALCLTALSFGTSFLSASLFSDILKLNLDDFTQALVDLTFGEGINLMVSGFTTAVSNQYPLQNDEASNTVAYHEPAPSTPYRHSGTGGSPTNTYSCIF